MSVNEFLPLKKARLEAYQIIQYEQRQRQVWWWLRFAQHGDRNKTFLSHGGRSDTGNGRLASTFYYVDVRVVTNAFHTEEATAPGFYVDSPGGLPYIDARCRARLVSVNTGRLHPAAAALPPH